MLVVLVVPELDFIWAGARGLEGSIKRLRGEDCRNQSRLLPLLAFSMLPKKASIETTTPPTPPPPLPPRIVH